MELFVNHYLPHDRKPPVAPNEHDILHKLCLRCGTAFVTQSRIKKRCDACQDRVSQVRKVRANLKLQGKRKKIRAGIL
jgi:uncharacterized OB-fold protein